MKLREKKGFIVTARENLKIIGMNILESCGYGKKK